MTYINYLPELGVQWKVGKLTKIEFGYFQSPFLPTLDQLQPAPNLTNPYLVYIGNPQLRQGFSGYGAMNLIHFNPATQLNWDINLAANVFQNKIATSSVDLGGGVQQLQYINVNGSNNLVAGFMFGFPLPFKLGNVSVDASSEIKHDISQVNAQISKATNFTNAITVDAHINIMQKLFVELSAYLNSQYISYSLENAGNTRTLSGFLKAGVNCVLSDRFLINTHYNLSVNENQGKIPSQIITLWNASINENLLKDRSLQLGLSLFDILNNASNFTENIGVNYVQTQRTNLPGRLLLLSAVYNFKKKK